MGSNRRYPDITRGHTVELLNDDGSVQVTLCAREPDATVALGIYTVAVANNPGARVILRHGARVLADSTRATG